MLMKKFILLYLFTLCTVLCAYSQSAVYVIFTPIESDTKGVEHSVFNIHNLGGGVVHIFRIFRHKVFRYGKVTFSSLHSQPNRSFSTKN